MVIQAVGDRGKGVIVTSLSVVLDGAGRDPPSATLTLGLAESTWKPLQGSPGVDPGLGRI